MSNDLWGSVIIGALVLGVLWWFFHDISNPFISDTKGPIPIVVKNGSYQPTVIQVRHGKPFVLSFERHDPSPCADGVIFPQLHASYNLPMNQRVEISLPPLNHGQVDFVCRLGSFKGKIIVI